MAPKLPGKFDDIAKAASSVLGDDFQCDGYQVKAKQATNFGGATYDLTVDYAATKEVKTPTKLSCKFPKPVPMLEGLSVDKLDFDKNGVIKTETSLSTALHGVDGLKIELKTDFGKALTYHSTFTGLKDTLLKFETSHSAPADFTLEALHTAGPCVIGCQWNGAKSYEVAPSFFAKCASAGLSYQAGSLFASVIAKVPTSAHRCSQINAHGLYTASKDFKLAATYQHGDLDCLGGAYSVGGSLSVAGGVAAKAKVSGKMSYGMDKVSVALTKELAKGAKLFCGIAYDIKKGERTYGAKLTIE